MKTAIIVDSACSLPSAIRTKYKVSLVPISYSIDEQRFIDQCDEFDAQAMFDSGSFSRKYEVHTQAPLPEDFEKAIVEKVKAGYQRIIIQTVSRTLGDSYTNAHTGLVRAQKQLDGRANIALRVMDSGTLFAGQGLMAIETIRRLLRSKDEAAVRKQMEALSQKVHTYIIPKEPVVALERSRERMESGLGSTQTVIANKLGIHPIVCNLQNTSLALANIWGFKNTCERLFKHVIGRIDEGALCPVITVNYAGDLADLNALPGYEEFLTKAKAHKIMVVPSVASIAGGIYKSAGSLSLAIATEQHEWPEKDISIKASLSGVQSLLRRRDS